MQYLLNKKKTQINAEYKPVYMNTKKKYLKFHKNLKMQYDYLHSLPA